MFPIVPNRLFVGRTKNNRHFGYPETKITDFKISGTCLGTTLYHCRLILETETVPGTKSRFHYLCFQVLKASQKLVEINTSKSMFFVEPANFLKQNLWIYKLSHFIELNLIPKFEEESTVIGPIHRRLGVMTMMLKSGGKDRQRPIFLLLTKNFLLAILCKYGNFSSFLSPFQ